MKFVLFSIMFVFLGIALYAQITVDYIEGLREIGLSDDKILEQV